MVGEPGVSLAFPPRFARFSLLTMCLLKLMMLMTLAMLTLCHGQGYEMACLTTRALQPCGTTKKPM